MWSSRSAFAKAQKCMYSFMRTEWALGFSRGFQVEFQLEFFIMSKSKIRTLFEIDEHKHLLVLLVDVNNRRIIYLWKNLREIWQCRCVIWHDATRKLGCVISVG